MERLEILYAKIVFKLNTERRLAIIHKLASLLRNNFSLMDALSRIEKIESKNGAKPDEPYAIVMREWQKNLEMGMSFADATRGWLPVEETLLVTSANVADLVVALENVDAVVNGIAIELPEEVESIIRRLEKEGYEACAVGGCVRDTLMGRVPQDC